MWPKETQIVIQSPPAKGEEWPLLMMLPPLVLKGQARLLCSFLCNLKGAGAELS